MANHTAHINFGGSSLQDGDILVYDHASGKFKNQPNSSGGVPTHQATVLADNASIITIPTVGIELVSAPGTGKITIPLLGTAWSNLSSGAYTGSSVPTLTLKYGDPVSGDYALGGAYFGGQGDTDSFITEALDSMLVVIAPAGVTGRDSFSGHTSTGFQSTALENQAIFIADDDNAGGPNYSGGNAANTIRFTLSYLTLDLNTGLYV